MILHAKSTQPITAQALDALIIQVQASHLHIVGQAASTDGKAVIMHGDRHRTLRINDRLVAAAMPKEHLVRFATKRKRQDLMP